MDRDLLPGYLMMAVGLLITAISLLGEWLGWWHNLGEWGGALGVALTVVGLAVTVLLGATKQQVAREGDATRGEIRALRDALTGRLDQLDGHTVQGFDAQAALLRDIRDALGTR